MSESNICATCPYESTIEELKRDAERNSTQHREFYNKFSDQSTQLAISEERYNNLISVVTDVKSSIQGVQTSVDELKQKPAKKWENIVSGALTTIIGLVLGFLFKMVLG